MNRFTLKLSPSATHNLDEIQKEHAETILEALPILEENPFPRGKIVKKIKGKKSTFYRLRVNQYRVFYFIHGREVVILKIIAKKNADRFIRNL